MNKVAIYLNRQISGNVFDNEQILEKYSTDHSIYKIRPKFVAFPETTEDIKSLVSFIYQLSLKNYRLPLGVRGNGSDTTGADLTNGLLIVTRRLNKIKEIDVHDRLIHVQAGVTLEQLNSTLMTHGLTLPINANPKETIGGLIANSPTDSYAAHYGGIMNYIDRIEVVLSDGACIQTYPLRPSSVSKRQSQNDLESKIYRKVPKLISENENLIENIRNTQNLAGYSSIADTISRDGKTFDLLPIFYGSQGTLGIITEVILRAEVLPPPKNSIYSVFSTFSEAFDYLSQAKSLNPLELHFYDIDILKKASETGKNLFPKNKKLPEKGFLLHLSYEKKRSNISKFNKFFNTLPKKYRLFLDENDSDTNTSIDNILLSYLNAPQKLEHSPVITNFYVPNSELKNFLYNLEFIEKKYKTKLNIFGSFATNIYHIRPELKFVTDEDKTLVFDLINNFNTLLKIHHGHIAGGSPEGRLKAPYTDFSKEEKDLYIAIKRIFDPENILSPDIKLGGASKTSLKNIRPNFIGIMSE